MAGSPIVLDLDRGGLWLTGLEESVDFDINGDDVKERVSWIVEGSGDGFLVLDRNASGTIDSGLELFGNHTVQVASDHPNGFLALAAFDRADHSAGDEDGWITENDGVYQNLKVWIDANHDGYSQREELLTLPEAGVEAIQLDYSESRSRDRHGNKLRYRSRVLLDRGTTRAVDVFFLVASSSD